MIKIMELTPKQEARLPIFREEIRAKALRLQWADDNTMRISVRSLYKCAGLKEPTVIVLDSPLACLLARTLLKNTRQLGGQLWDQLGGQLWDQLGGQLGDQLWDQLRGQLGDQLRGQLGDQLWGQLGDQLWDQLGDQLRGQLGDQLWDQLRGQLGDQLRGQLGDQLWDQLGDQLGDQLAGDVFQPTIFAGGSEFYWTAWYKYAQEIGVRFDRTDWLDSWINYAETCGPLYPYEGVVFVSRRPVALSFNENRLLHCENGPAMAFGDGFDIYAWNGTRLPKTWVMEKDTIDPSEILATENVEQRAAGAACVGWPRMAEKLGQRVIDGDPESDLGALVEMTIPGLPEPGRFLMAKCPRNGTICEGVPRTSDIDGLPIETAISAQAWRDCLPASEYSHPAIRT